MTRAYLRLDPDYFERRLERGDPPGAIGAFVAVLCLAESQPKRGRFRNEAILRALLTPPFARWVPYMLEHQDLIPEGKRLYVDGWDEWQEGDRTVTERMARVRNRHRNADTNGVTPDVTVEDTVRVTTARLAEAEALDNSGKRRRKAEAGPASHAGPIPLSDILGGTND